MDYSFKTTKDLKNIIYFHETPYNDLCPFTIKKSTLDKSALQHKYKDIDISSSSFQNSLEVLKTPESFIDLNYLSSGSELSYSIFYKDNRWISLQYTKDDVTLCHPANYQEIFEGLENFTGNTTVKYIDITEKLSLEELILLLSAIDLQRREILLNYAKNKSLNNCLFDEPLLASYLEKKSFSQNDFLYYFEDFISELKEVPSAFESLVTKGYFLEKENSYLLKKNYFYNAANCLLIENFIHLKNVLNNEQKCTVLESFVLQFGLGSLIKFSFNQKNVEVVSLSSFGMYAWLESIIENQSLILKQLKDKKATNNPNTAKTENSFNYCPNCGASYNKKPNFCGQCGEKLK